MRARTLQLLHSVRHLHPWQVGGRLWAAARPRLGLPRLPPVPPTLSGHLPARVSREGHDPWNTPEALAAGRFTFIGQTADLGTPVDWAAPGMPLLWRFNLHYFQFLHRLDRDAQVALVRHWMEAHPPGTAVAWHPYPTSLRIVNACRAGFSEPDILASLYLQAASLFRTQETYVRGNHLLENARALVVAGRFFEGQGEAPRWLARGLEIVRRLTPEVVLPDGGFYERSPMYHALMLEAWLDVINVMPESHPDVPALAETARRMNDYLASVTHPDGQLFLFNDATQEIAPHPADLHAYAERLLGVTPTPRTVLPDTGVYIHASDDVYLAIDGGKLAPDDLPAHGHADLFTYELSIGGRQIVTDSGVYEYQAGPRRQYGRSTRAHNTVTIDNTDQAEVYGSFRVARRYDPRDVTFDTVPGRSHFRGTFDGYARLLGDGLTHRREIVAADAARTITVTDHVTGTGTHTVGSRIHLHPDVAFERAGDTWILRRDDREIRFTASGVVALETAPYSPRFGVAIDRTVLVLRHEGALPATLSYTIQY